jgi:hypothetical protein
VFLSFREREREPRLEREERDRDCEGEGDICRELEERGRSREIWEERFDGRDLMGRLCVHGV